MNQQARIEKISNIIAKDSPHGRQDIPWQDELKPMDVYKIPLEYLVYNKYNGRILSRTKSLERQHQEIDVETAEGRALIEELLFKTNETRNKQTLESLKRVGQEKVGIITKDGIIIDGNRRAMLLNKAGKTHFKAVVLDATLEDKALEIEELETSFQMGEDEKLGYNPTEKYLKASQLEKRNVSISKIATWMGETETTVKKYLKVMKIMDDYLDYLDLNGIYTQLDGREDQFITLADELGSLYGAQSGKGFDGYKDSDVDDLKSISYDYIRIRYEGKDFRYIGYGRKENHFFGTKDIWTSFRDNHFENMDSISSQEEKIDYDSKDLEKHLNSRDDRFFQLTKTTDSGKSFLQENLDDHVRKLNNIKYADKPLKLVHNALDSLNAIDQKHRAASGDEVLDQIQKITQLTNKMMIKKSPRRILGEISDSLKAIDFTDTTDDKEDLISAVKEVQRVSYQIEKELKHTK